MPTWFLVKIIKIVLFEKTKIIKRIICTLHRLLRNDGISHQYRKTQFIANSIAFIYLNLLSWQFLNFFNRITLIRKNKSHGEKCNRESFYCFSCSIMYQSFKNKKGDTLYNFTRYPVSVKMHVNLNILFWKKLQWRSQNQTHIF